MIATGTTIGDCEVLAPLTGGGMGTLYLARRTGDAGFARYLAVKVVHPHLARDQAFVRMFLDEARLLARVSHPNVVHVETLGRKDNDYYLVMEYVHGCSLQQLLRELAHRGRRLAPDVAVAIALRVADGLHAAHEATDERGESLGLVHRDVSPHNVLLAYSGQVKLIDFGIAKARGRLEQTHSGSIRGKIAYMAPEQALRKPIDRRTDIYALGVVLWEMLTGRRMVKGEDEFELLDRVRAPLVVPPSHYVPDLPPAVEAVVLAALAFAPDARPPTAHALRRNLATALPAACAYGDADLAGLLAAAMADEIAAARAHVPAELAAPAVPAAGIALETLTNAALPTPDPDLSGELAVPDERRSDAGLSAAIAPRVATPTPAHPRRRSRVARAAPWLAALAATLIGSLIAARAASVGSPTRAHAASVVAAPAPAPIAVAPAPAPAPIAPAVQRPPVEAPSVAAHLTASRAGANHAGAHHAGAHTAGAHHAGRQHGATGSDEHHPTLAPVNGGTLFTTFD